MVGWWPVASSLKTVYWIKEEREDWVLHSSSSEFGAGL